MYKASPAPAFSITFVGAAHMDFVDNPASCWNCGACGGGTAPKDRTNQLTIKYATAYFLSTLGGERRAVGGARLVHELAAERQAEAGLDAP